MRDEDLHPAVLEMDDEMVAVLAGYGRAIDPEGDPFAHMSDRELASTLLNLQDAGFLTLGISDDYEEASITLHTDDLQRHKAKKRRTYRRPKW